MVLVGVILCALAVAVGAQVRVSLDQGVATGRVDSTPIGDVTKFLGLPYARAPVGKYRFRPPMTHQGWGPADYDASLFRANCMQRKEHLQHFYGLSQANIDGMQFSEDCLYLNVFLPGRTVDENAGLPVMVWIHGGNFQFSSGQIVGTTSKESPEALVVSGNVIVVTINYRLSAFGFLTLFSEESVPNVGILDQVKAIRWVRENIEKFGGNPGMITLFGDDVGAFSISLHLLIEPSYGLFTRAAISSGVYTAGALPTKQKAAIKWCQYADTLGCRNANSNATSVMMCLQEKSAEDLVDKLPNMTPGVVVDYKLLKDQPMNLLKRGQFNPVDLIIGCNVWNGDYFLFGRPFARAVYEKGLLEENVEMLMDRLAMIGFPKANTKIGRKLQRIMGGTYFTNLTDPHQTLKEGVKLLRDGLFWAPVMTYALYNMEAGKPTYVYFFEKTTPASEERHAGSLLQGAGFGDEVSYIMGDVSATSGEEKRFTDSVMRAWSTFARNGEPQFLDDQNALIDWPKFDKTMMRLGWSSPMYRTNMGNFVPKGPLYFNTFFKSYLELLQIKEKEKYAAKPNGMGWPMTGKPEMGRPGMGKPEMGSPEMARPETGKPETGRPEMGWPEMGRPDMGKPEMGKPETGKPGMWWPGKEGKPEMGKPETGRPENGTPESEKIWKERSNDNAAPEMTAITNYVMLAFISLLVLLMVIIFGVICSMYNQMRNTPKGSNF